MKILMISPVAVMGGAEEVFLRTAISFQDDSKRVAAVLLEDGELAVRLRDSGIEVEVITSGRTRQIHRTILAVARLRAFSRRFAPDFVFSSHAKAQMFAAIALAGSKTPRAWRQVLIPDPPSIFDRLASWSRSEAVICNSLQTAQIQQPLTKSRCVVVHPGTDMRTFLPGRNSGLLQKHLKVAAGTPVIGLVGRLQRWKGQLEFVEAAIAVAADFPDIHFAIIGADLGSIEPTYVTDIRSRIEGSGLASRIHLAGHMANPELWIGDLHLSVNASTAEPFGNVVIQSLAVGVPVLAVNAGGPREIINSRNGILVESNTPAAIEMGLRSYLSDPALREQLRSNARASVELKYSQENMMGHFNELARALTRESSNDI